MCFNATASYASGLAITAVGVASLPAVEDRRELGFAAIPVVLGVHQLLEGAIWEQVEASATLPVRSGPVWAWLAVAWLLLPVGVPLAAMAFEVDRRRRLLMGALGLLGLAVAAVLLGAMLTGAPGARVGSHHLTYDLPLSIGWPLAVGYVAATCGSLLVASRRFVVVTGIAMLLAMAISALAYASGFTSVW